MEALEVESSKMASSTGIWKLISFLIVLWIVLNRAIPDLYVLPIGVSVRPSQAVLVLVGALLVVAWLSDPRPGPRGLPAVLGLLLVLTLVVAPFRLSASFSQFEIDGSERAMQLLVIYVVLFLAGYWLAQSERSAALILNTLVAMSTWQAVLAIYEWRAGFDAVATSPIWSLIGLSSDSVIRGSNFRKTGLFRPSSTAPHPIVLSALIAVGIMIAVVLFINTDDRRRRRRLLLALGPMTLGLMLVDTRTGFVVLGVLTIVIVALSARRLPRLLPLAVAAFAALIVVAAIAPSSIRSTLNLFWNAGDDTSVNLRVDRLADLPELISQEPILGAGWLTNDPKVYLFDNAYSHALLELGIAGTALLLFFLGASIVRMVSSRRYCDRNGLTLVLAGVIGAFAILAGAATFDAMHFDQFLPTCLLLIGMGLSGADQVSRSVPDEPQRILHG